MTLPASGPLSMTAIAAEASVATSTPVSINTPALRSLAQVYETDSTIKFSDFQGKSKPIYVDTTFVNGDFSGANFTDSNGDNYWDTEGWIIYTGGQVWLNGVSTIGGYPTPNDPTPNGGYASSPGETTGTSFSYSFSLTSDLPPAYSSPVRSCRLLSTGYTVGYGIVHGPYLISSSNVPLCNGDIVTFWWKAEGGADAFDIFAYLLNVDTGATIKLLDQTGTSTGATTSWAAVNRTMNTGGGDIVGNYKFVFISGSYDFTGGTFLGASLFVTNINVTKAGPAGDFSTLAAYLASHNTEFQNASFYSYNLDGDATYIYDGGGDMYDSGNYVYPWFAAGTPDYSTTITGQAGALSAAATVTTVDTSFVYTGLGTSVLPRTHIAYRTATGVPIGFQKNGNVGADGSGTLTASLIYSNATVNGFQVFAYYRQTSNASDPSVCDLYMIIGHPWWGSVYGTFNVYSDPSSTNSGGSYAYMSGANIKNLMAISTLLSKSGGVAVTVAEMKTVIDAYTSRIKTHYQLQ